MKLADFVLLFRIPNLLVALLALWGSCFWLFPSPFSDFFPTLLPFSAAHLLAGAAAYLVNDLLDYKADLVNRPNSLLIGRKLAKPTGWKLYGLLIFLSLATGLWAGKLTFLLIAGLNFALWLYAFQVRRWPLAGNLLAALLTAEAVWGSMLLTGTFAVLPSYFAAFAFAANLLREIVKDMEDQLGDAAAGYNSVPLQWGEKAGKWIVSLTAGLSIIGGCWFWWQPGGYSEKTFWLLALLLCILLVKLWKTTKTEGYHKVSGYMKAWMLAGISTMPLAGWEYFGKQKASALGLQEAIMALL